MKNLIILLCVCLFSAPCSAELVKLCYETQKKINKSVKFTNLTATTVAELGAKIRNDKSDYKVVFVYNPCDVESYFARVVAPFLNSPNSKGASVYLVANNCGYLKGVDALFDKNNISLTRYYIKDTTEIFGLNPPEGTRRYNEIAKNLCSNANELDTLYFQNNTFILDKNNRVKLIKYTNMRDGKEKSTIQPFPLAMVNRPLSELDFNKTEVRELTKEADSTNPIYILYFWQKGDK